MSRLRKIALLVAVYGARSLDAQSSQNLTVRGVVTDSTGKPIPYAYVYERLRNKQSVSDYEGKFQLDSLSGDSVFVGARKIGFAPVEVLIALKSNSPARIVMPVYVTALATVNVFARAGYDEYLDRNGFYRRQAKSAGVTFLSPEEVERRNATETTQLLRNVPGVGIISGGSGGRKANVPVGRGRQCPLGLVVDGQLIGYTMPPPEALRPTIAAAMGASGGRAGTIRRNSGGGGTFDEMIDPRQVKAIEVYPSANSVPIEFAHHVDGCGLIVVWTKFQ